METLATGRLGPAEFHTFVCGLRPAEPDLPGDLDVVGAWAVGRAVNLLASNLLSC